MEYAAQDEIIARTVYSFVLWGFSLRAEIYPVVAKAASERFGGDARSIGPDRVEQIYETWRKYDPHDPSERRSFPPLQPRRYVRASLKRYRPNMKRLELAKLLMDRGGRWSETDSDGENYSLYMSPELTEKELRRLLLFPNTAAGRKAIEDELRSLQPRPRGRPRKTTKVG